MKTPSRLMMQRRTKSWKLWKESTARNREKMNGVMAHGEDCLSPMRCDVTMFFPRHRKEVRWWCSQDKWKTAHLVRQSLWWWRLEESYRDKTRDGSWRKRLRYAAISVATVLKSFTLSRRSSLMISFSPARYVSFSSSVCPSRAEPIWMRILSSVKVNGSVVSIRTG